MKNVIIIGSGIAGLAASVRLANAGYKVNLLEKNDFAGGKLSEVLINGYRFDAGPSLFTMPELIEELFEISNIKTESHFSYVKLDHICRYFFQDDLIINALANPSDFANEIENKTGEKAEKVIRHLEKAAEIYKLTAPVFIFKEWSYLQNLINPKFWKAFLNIRKLDVFSTVHDANAKNFSHPAIIQLFDRYATYNGSNPYKAPATLNVIPHIEYNKGAFLPKKGMYSIIESLITLAKAKGVNFHFNQEVKKICFDKSGVSGIETTKGFFPSKIIVSNSDIELTYKMLGKEKKYSKAAKEKSTSALVFNWGIKGKFNKLALHNIFFTTDYKKEFEDLFDKKRIPADPTIYLFISSKMVASDAPPGCENWFTMINMPAGIKVGDKEIAEIRKTVIEKISNRIGECFEDKIECEWILTPEKLEDRTNSIGGAIYGNASNSKWSAFQRHQSRVPGIKGLYVCGGSVHPGGGIPLCLSSAKIAVNKIIKNEAKS
ncbi:MAG: phytoene desaturase [Chitinophagaceae bacterium]|nr:MAG: phytoene desaturase [Chitinophagaceae bacterium]